MTQLSTMDASFLYSETPETPMHVAGLAIFRKPDGYDRDFFREYRDFVIARTPALDYMHRKLGYAPLSPTDPIWVDSGPLDFDYHIRQMALPAPGDDDKLNDLVARLHAIPLDRARPLWQFYVIEGLAGDRVAVYSKTHHACLDGGAGMVAMEVLMEHAPEGDPLPPMPAPEPPRPHEPIWLRQLTEGYVHMLRTHLKMVENAPDYLRALDRMGRRAMDDLLNPGASPLRSAPRTPLNVAIDRERSYGTLSLPLGDLKAAAKAMGGKLNDVVMTLCGGAVRRYLMAVDGLPEEPLIAGVPASLRKPGDFQMNNQVTMMLVALATDIEDPAERMAAIVAATTESKDRLGMVKDALTLDLSVYGAPIYLSGLNRIFSGAKMADQLPPMMNLVVSNVPGPREPRYLLGCEMEHYYPVSIANNGVGLNITVQSYLDWVDIGFIAGKAAMPDAHLLRDMMRAEFEAMKQAAGIGGAEAAVEARAAAPAPTPMPTPMPSAQEAPDAAVEAPAPKQPAPEPAAAARPRARRKPAKASRAAAEDTGAAPSAPAPKRAAPRRRAKKPEA